VADDQPNYFTKLNEKIKIKIKIRAKVFAEGKRRNSLQSKRRGIGE